MGILEDLAPFCQDTITIAPKSTTNVNNEITWGAAVSYKARVVRRYRAIRTDRGDEKLSRALIYIMSAPGTTVESKITLPDGTTPLILRVNTYPDEAGQKHEEIFV